MPELSAPVAPVSTAPVVAPPTAQPSPAGTPPAAVPSPLPINNAFEEIDKIIVDSQQKRPEPKKAQAPKPEAPKPEAAKTEAPKPEAEQQTKPDETAALKAPELRAAYANLKKSHKEAQEKITAAEARIKELESKAGDPAQLTKLQEQIQAAEKRAQELAEKIKFVDYEKSPEYKEKFFDPFVNGYQNARNKIASLKVVEQRDEFGDVVQESRRATSDDFDAIMRIQDDGEAAEAAAKMFGPTANLVMLQREKVMDLNSARVNAIEEYRKKGGEREQQTSAQQQAAMEKAKTIYKQSIEAGIEKYPQWFKAEDSDEQGKTVLEKGLKNADMIFAKNNLPPEERANLHASVRNMAGAFPYVALKLHRAESRIKELETELGQYKSSEPGAPGAAKPGRSEFSNADDEIDALAKVGR